MAPLPPEKNPGEIIGWDALDVDLNRLCKFACKYGYCPGDVCTLVSAASDLGDDVATVDDAQNFYNYTDER